MNPTNESGRPAAAAAIVYELVVTAGQAKGATLALAKKRVAFGSALGSDIRLDEPGVRPSHAEMAYAADGSLWIRDLTGAGETTVNGTPVTTAKLERGATIRLGTVEMSVQARKGTGGFSGPNSAARPSGPNPRVSGPNPRVSGPNPAARPSGAAPAANSANRTSGPNNTFVRPSGSSPAAKPKTGPNNTFVRPSGSNPAERPKTGPNNTFVRPSGSNPAERPKSGPNNTFVRPSGQMPAADFVDESGDQQTPEQMMAERYDDVEEPTDPTAMSMMLRPQQVIDNRYRIVAKLAAGGMGEVYRAEHVELGKSFALKVMKREMSADPEFVERFKREAITASRIGQQNIVDISDFGRTEGGLFYFVMEFLEGETLADLLRRERVLPVERALPIILQISRALSAAHKQGIVHRDLKPENVMLLQRPGQPDFVKVLDFGVAKVADGHGKGGQTALGIVLGTPQYMSPEQAAGTAVDPRSDIYSLGLIIYEMVAGRPVFEEPTPSLLMVAHINRPPPPMTPGPLTPLPEGLENLVMRTLEKQVADRPQTLDEVSAVLENCMPSRGRRSGAFGGVTTAPNPATGSLNATGPMSGPMVAAPGQSPSLAVPAVAPAPSLAVPAVAPPKSRAPLFVAAALVVAAAVGGGAYFGMQKPPPPPEVVVAPPKVPDPVPTPVIPVANPPTPDLVMLSVKAKPERVEVYDGEVMLGTTPVELKWAKGKVGQLRFVAAGFLDETRTVAPQADIVLEIALKEKRAVGKTGGPKNPGGNTAAPNPGNSNPYGDPVEDLKDAPY